MYFSINPFILGFLCFSTVVMSLIMITTEMISTIGMCGYIFVHILHHCYCLFIMQSCHLVRQVCSDFAYYSFHYFYCVSEEHYLNISQTEKITTTKCMLIKHFFWSSPSLSFSGNFCDENFNDGLTAQCFFLQSSSRLTFTGTCGSCKII